MNKLRISMQRLLIFFTRISPILFSLAILFSIISSLYDYDNGNIINEFLFGNGLLVIVLLYLLSYVLRFCMYHIILIHYMSFNWMIMFVDGIIGLPVSDKIFAMFLLIITGIAGISSVLAYLKYGDRSKEHQIQRGID